VRGGMTNLIKQARKMQEKLEKAKEELKEIRVEGSAGGGVVKVTATADEQIHEIRIQKEVVDPEQVEMLQDLVLTAVNQALEQARAKSQEKLGPITGGLDLPFNL